MDKKAGLGQSAMKLLRRAGVEKLPKGVNEALKQSYKGEVPFLATPLKWGASKIVGAKAVDKAIYKTFHKPLAALDIGAGQVLKKGLGKITKKGKHLFDDKRVLETGTKKGLQTGGKEHYIPSALAPVKKVGAFAIPALGAMKLEEMVKGKKKMGDQKLIKEADLKKTAEMLHGLNIERNQFKKEAKATELLYKQAELGQITMPRTFAEYQEKVAELLGKDLDVMEEAIKIASSSENELGGLDDTARLVSNPRTAFQQSILD